MVPLVMLASIPVLFGIESSAPDAEAQAIRSAKNGEFLWDYYPPGALKRGEQGRVAFTLTIEPTCTISGCQVTESSGFVSLDKETCDIMGLYARLQPVRNDEGRAIRADQQGFIVWKLPPGATKIAVATRTTAPKPDRLICRKDTTTGSLIATTTQCLTKSEWDRQQNITRDATEQLQGKDTIMQGN
jgi:TonB family protein